MHEEDIRQHTDIYKRLLDSLYDGVYVTDVNRQIIYWNKGAERLTGYKAEEVTGRHCHDNLLVHVDAEGTRLCTSLCPLAETLQDGRMREVDVFLHHKNGHRVPVSVRVSPICDDEGDIVGAVEIFRDNGEKIAALELAESLHEKSITDDLTKTANRWYSEVSLLAKLDEMQENGMLFGALLVDVDDLKQLNERLGRPAGDELLRCVAKSLLNGVKSFDFVGRWEDDEFLVIFANVRSESALRERGEQLRILVAHSFLRLGGEDVIPTISGGCTLCREGDSTEEIVARATRALAASKREGKNRTTVLV